MLAWWFELLPLFVVRWAARRYCERCRMPPMVIANARPDVFVGCGRDA